VGFGSVLFG